MHKLTRALASTKATRSARTRCCLAFVAWMLASCGGSEAPGTTDTANERETPMAVSATASGWVKVADETQSFTITGTQSVRFGVAGRWVTKTVTGTAPCTNAFFGRDPAFNVRKQCERFQPAPALPAAVSLAWALPSPGTTVSGSNVQLRLTGQSLRNVEIFNAGTLVTRATVAADLRSATAVIDTRQFRNGPLTLTAHAWNSAPGTTFTSEAEAGALNLTVYNAVVDAGSRPKLGVYTGNDVASVLAFEAWLGRRVDGVLGYGGHASWSDYDGSIPWAASLWRGIDRPVFWSIPLIPTGATLEQAAAGHYDDHYRRAALALVRFRPQEPRLNIRTGWEFNGNWFPWSAQGKAAHFRGAFRRFVTVFRDVARENGVPDRFVFEWNVNLGDVGMNPAEAYPGNDVVDVIGMDFYWDTRWDPADPEQAWNSVVNRPYGLKWHQDFAAARGKPTSYSEWGIRSDNAAPYIRQANAWFLQHKVLFHTYWDSQAAFPGKLSSGQYPQAGASFRETFRTP